MMKYDEAALRDVVCPLCESKAALRPISGGRRLLAGPWSFDRPVARTHECTARGATFGTQELIESQKAA